MIPQIITATLCFFLNRISISPLVAAALHHPSITYLPELYGQKISHYPR
jgi:hypothetical protein